MRKILLCVLIFTSVLAAVLGYSLPGISSHFTYLAEDSSLQLNFTDYTDNYVMAKWWWAQPVLWWSDAAISTDAQAVMTNWQIAIPQLTFAPASDMLSSNLWFHFATNPFPCPDVLGCFSVEQPENRIWERASYIQRGIIWMNENYNWTGAGATARQGLLAHELGHAHGLHERYIEGPPVTCNNAETTIMDSFVITNDMPFQCDGLTGPSALDIQRVVDYWSKGEAFSFTGAVQNRLIVGMWKDHAWTEDSYALGFYYLDQYNNWGLYHSRGMHDELGVHQLTENRTLAAAADPAVYGAPIPSWQMVCATPYFPPYNQWGTFRCGPALWVE